MFGTRGLRPVVPSFVPEVLAILMQRCWHKDPDARPEFSEVVELNSTLFEISASDMGSFFFLSLKSII